jgi:Holliday junction resolvase
MSFRRAARVDANQSEIVKAFRKLGWYVLIISQLKNCCDLIVSKNGRTIAIEVKDGNKPKSQQKLSDGEVKFMNEWQGEYMIVNSVEQVVNLKQ